MPRDLDTLPGTELVIDLKLDLFEFLLKFLDLGHKINVLVAQFLELRDLLLDLNDRFLKF